MRIFYRPTAEWLALRADGSPEAVAGAWDALAAEGVNVMNGMPVGPDGSEWRVRAEDLPRLEAATATLGWELHSEGGDATTRNAPLDYQASRPVDPEPLVRAAREDPVRGARLLADAHETLVEWLRETPRFLPQARDDLHLLDEALRDARAATREDAAGAEKEDARLVSETLRGLPGDDAYKAMTAMRQLLDVTRAFTARTKEDAASVALPDEIPGLRATLRPYQEEGVRFLLSRDLNAILADDMGLGKTVTTIAAILATPDARALVVAPANVLYNWRDEITDFTHAEPAVWHHGVLTGSPDARFLLTTYDALANLDPDEEPVASRTVLVLDEAHYVRNTRTRRARLVAALPQKRRILLTGTPMVNGIEDYHALLTQVAPRRWGSRARFKRTWIVEPALYNKYAEVREATAALLARAAGDVLLRRRKEDVLRDLPPRIIRVRHHALTPAGLRRYRRLEARAARALREDADAPVIAALHAMRQHLVRARVPVVLERIRALLDRGENVVAYAEYLDPLHKLADALGEDVAVVLEGATDAEDRQEYANALGEPGGPRVLLAQMEAGGVGLNLTAARHVLFVHLGWTPAAHAQAMDRVHRIGQDRPVLVEFLVTPDTIDERMARILLRKESDQNLVLEDDADVLNRDALRGLLTGEEAAHEVTEGAAAVAEVP